MVYQVTNIDLSTNEFKETFVKFDIKIHWTIKADKRGYEVSKPSPHN